jgi:DNA-binding NtrC family response regulator
MITEIVANRAMFAESDTVEPNNSRTVLKNAQVKVLVVDDEPLIRWAVTEMLGDLGYRAVEAGDARGAIAALSESAPFEIMLLDVRLPDADGLTLFNRIRTLAPSARVILMTAHATRELTDRAIALGAFAVVGKPFELTELADLVSRARQA